MNVGDYICYKLKNELGKIKRVQDDNLVFAWFHTGDTAARISKDMFDVVLTNTSAKCVSQETLIQILREKGFSNDYAIEEIVKKGE